MSKQRLTKIYAGLVSLLVLAGFYYGFGNNQNPNSLPDSYVNESVDVIQVNPQQTDVVGVWTNGAVLPVIGGFGSGQSGTGYFRNDTGWVFFVGNASPANSNVVYSYNVNTNIWATLATLPSGRDRLSCAVLKDSLYAVAGASTATVYSNTLYKYDIKANLWTTKAPLPVSQIGWTGSVGYQDSLIYVAGGNDGLNPVNTVYLYNAISNTWRTASNLPAIRFGGGFSKSGDTLVYAAGLDAAVTQTTTYKGLISQSDRAIIAWTTGAPAPIAIFRTSAAEWGSKGIIMTNGSTSTAFTGITGCYVYSPGANTWTTQASKTTSTTYSTIGSVMLANGIWKLVCTGGYTGAAYANNTEIFTDTLGLVGINGGNNQIPAKYLLSQNYPNPFNPSTTIEYGLPKAGFVTVVAYDITGKVIKTLVNEFKNSGTYNISFDASSLSSGVYFYRISAGEFRDTKKMLLIK